MAPPPEVVYMTPFCLRHLAVQTCHPTSEIAKLSSEFFSTRDAFSASSSFIIVWYH